MHTDWIMGLIGGGMIGLAAAIYLLGLGRIMGASGIVGGLIDGSSRAVWPERLAFIAGVIAVPMLLRPVLGAGGSHATDSIVLLVLGGLAVGVGTRLANGCTSGHGVCGMSRLSWRGIAASALYVGAGVASVAALRHGLGVL